MARRTPFSWLALQKARREVRKFLSPPLLWLAPHSDHGSAACAETEAFFQYGPPRSFFELSWLALQKARAREVAQRLMTGRKFLSPPPSYGSLRNPITGVPRARKLKLFSKMAKSTRAGSWRNDDDRAQISQPPLLWLAPQSDHGSAARAETEAFFQDCPPQSFFQLSWLALQKARREVGARTDDRAQISQPPLLWLAPQSDHGSAARAETEAFFFNMACNPFSSATQLARPTKSTCAGSWRND